MKKAESILVGLMAVVMAAPLALAGEQPGRVVDRLQVAYRDGSVECMLALYNADATFEDINQRHIFSGTEQLRAMLANIVVMHLKLLTRDTRGWR